MAGSVSGGEPFGSLGDSRPHPRPSLAGSAIAHRRAGLVRRALVRLGHRPLGDGSEPDDAALARTGHVIGPSRPGGIVRAQDRDPDALVPEILEGKRLGTP